MENNEPVNRERLVLRIGGVLAVVGGHGSRRGCGSSRATLFLDVPHVPFPLLFGGFIIPLNIWLAVIGLPMWCRA